MPILRSRPVVFISSAIAGLETLRQALHENLTALNLVDGWVFEIHATAGGEPAEAQYLDLARRCDVFLLIVGEHQSQATEDEYREAFDDNRDKIIPIYLGKGDSAVKAFRRLIDSRHSRDQAADSALLVSKAVSAVERAVCEGRLIATPLRRGFEARLETLDRLLDLQPGQAYLPVVQRADAVCDLASVLTDTNRVVVTGIGGSGKTYGTLVTLHRLSWVRRRRSPSSTTSASAIPLYLRASRTAHRIDDLIESAFSGARFFPGNDLTSQYARDGRLVIAVDGYDDLDTSTRRELLEEVDRWAEAHPRCGVIFLARALPSAALAGFERLETGRLTDTQLVALFAGHGQQLRGEHDIPPELSDLIRRPFWAGAIAQFGLDAHGGLELVGRVIDRRLALASDGEPTDAYRMRLALGELALAIRPALTISTPEALAVLSEWNERPTVAAALSPRPADAVLDQLRTTGVLQAESSDFVFVHALLTARLAAEAAVLRADLYEKVVGDDELAAFSGALAPQDKEDQLLRLLAVNDIFFLARVLRLSCPRPRVVNLEADLQRYQAALRSLAPLAGQAQQAIIEASGVAAAVGDGWTALTHIAPSDVVISSSYADLEGLAAGGEIVLWTYSPFDEHAPELVAAAEILMRFKRAFDALTHTDPDLSAAITLPPAGDALDEALLQRAYAVRSEEMQLRTLTETADSRLATLAGEPHLIARQTDWGRDLEEDWGHGSPEVSIEPVGPGPYDALEKFFGGDPSEQARRRLRQSVESELGSALRSAAWNKPTALAGWVW